MTIKRKRRKEEFYKKSETYEFGNRLQTWNTVQSYIDSKHSGLVSIRSRAGAGGGPCVYDLKNKDEVRLHLDKFVKQGYREELFILSESAPDDKILVQGELCRSINHYELTYSYMKSKMRISLVEQKKTASGLEALLILKSNLTTRDYEDLQGLLDEYPESVIEFSAYTCKLGWLGRAGSQMVIWEVRNY